MAYANRNGRSGEGSRGGGGGMRGGQRVLILSLDESACLSGVREGKKSVQVMFNNDNNLLLKSYE